jgi:hypothetical protein
LALLEVDALAVPNGVDSFLPEVLAVPVFVVVLLGNLPVFVFLPKTLLLFAGGIPTEGFRVEPFI